MAEAALALHQDRVTLPQRGHRRPGRLYVLTVSINLWIVIDMWIVLSVSTFCTVCRSLGSGQRKFLPRFADLLRTCKVLAGGSRRGGGGARPCCRIYHLEQISYDNEVLSIKHNTSHELGAKDK